MKALVFDQLRSVADDIGETLRRLPDTEVDVVYDRASAERQLRENTYDLGVLGVQYPGSFGDDLASRMKESDGWTFPGSQANPAVEEHGLYLVEAIRSGRDHNGQGLGMHNMNMQIVVHSPSMDSRLAGNSAYLGAEMCCSTAELAQGEGAGLIARVQQMRDMELYEARIKRQVEQWAGWMKEQSRSGKPTPQVNAPGVSQSAKEKELEGLAGGSS